MKKFWIVVGLNENGTHLTYEGGNGSYHQQTTYLKHSSKELAENEAMRLTNKLQRPFGVMELVGGFQLPKPNVEVLTLS